MSRWWQLGTQLLVVVLVVVVEVVLIVVVVVVLVVVVVYMRQYLGFANFTTFTQYPPNITAPR